jgi:hypothetical protein
MILYQDIERAKHKYEEMQREYLRQRGWVETSQTPGCYWVWTKEVPGYGKLMAVDSQAVRMQCSMTPDPESEDAE